MNSKSIFDFHEKFFFRTLRVLGRVLSVSGDCTKSEVWKQVFFTSVRLLLQVLAAVHNGEKS